MSKLKNRMSLSKRKKRKGYKKRHRIAPGRRELLIEQAIPTAPYVIHHQTRGVNESGGRHIPETEAGHRMVDKRVIVGVDRYLVNNELVITGGPGTYVRIPDIMASVAWTNQLMHGSWSEQVQLPGSAMEVSRLEVMQNDIKSVSAMMGSTFARGIASFARAGLTLNPCGAGNPDLIPTGVYNDLMERHRAGEKVNWSRISDGIEIKGTCGAVKGRELDHPYGTTRVDSLTTFTFSAHHNNNSVLLGVLWDHIAGVPQIVGVFYGNNFTKNNFGGEKSENLGERSTPVVQLNREGKDKLLYVCVLNDSRCLERVSHILPRCDL